MDTVGLTDVCALVTATLSDYLLEKSRVAVQNGDERNYHIFYWMWSGLGADGVKPLGLGKPKDHHYLNGEGCPSDKLLFSDKWKKEYEEVVGTFRVLGVEQDTIDEMFKVLAAILLLGDSTYKVGRNDEAVLTSDEKKLDTVAQHLGCEEAKLKKALISTSTETRGEVSNPGCGCGAARCGRSPVLVCRSVTTLDYREKPQPGSRQREPGCREQGHLPASVWLDHWTL
jgi:myosin heavy subunit